jgi:hypothetical protein
LLSGLLWAVLMLLVLHILRSHGNYFTAIAYGIGTGVCQLILFALRIRDRDGRSDLDRG